MNAEIGYERSDTRQDIGIPRRCDAAPVLIVTNAAQIKECRDKDLNWKFWWRLTITTWSSLLYDMFDTIDFELVYEKTYITIHNIHYIILYFSPLYVDQSISANFFILKDFAILHWSLFKEMEQNCVFNRSIQMWYHVMVVYCNFYIL